jgi:hypothetical protein
LQTGVIETPYEKGLLATENKASTLNLRTYGMAV